MKNKLADFLGPDVCERRWLAEHPLLGPAELGLDSLRGLALLQGCVGAGTTTLGCHLTRRLAAAGEQVLYLALDNELKDIADRVCPDGRWDMNIRVVTLSDRRIHQALIARQVSDGQRRPSVLFVDGLSRIEPSPDPVLSARNSANAEQLCALAVERLALLPQMEDFDSLRLVVVVHRLGRAVPSGRHFPLDVESLRLSRASNWVGNVWRPAQKPGLSPTSLRQCQNQVCLEVAKSPLGRLQLLNLIDVPGALHHQPPPRPDPASVKLKPAGPRTRVSALGS